MRVVFREEAGGSRVGRLWWALWARLRNLHLILKVVGSLMGFKLGNEFKKFLWVARRMK